MSHISVIIPVYDAAKYVRQAVKSALEQPETGEVLLIEDNSPDDSLEMCRQIASEDDRVRLLQHPDGVNLGPAASRNLGIINAKYEYIAFLDADDYYLSDRFASSVEILKNSPDVDGVYEASEVFVEDDSIIALHRPGHAVDGRIVAVKKSVAPADLFEAMLLDGSGWFHTNAITVRKRIFERTGLFDVELILHQDVAMWMKLTICGKLVNGESARPVARIRKHGGNRHSRASEEQLLKSKYMEWEILWKWAKSQQIMARRRLIILLIYLKAMYRYKVYNRSILSRCSEMSLIIIRVIAHPGELASLLQISTLRILFSRRVSFIR